jgi:hypothetical protein
MGAMPEAWWPAEHPRAGEGDAMTRIRAAVNAALVFAGICLMLGSFGALLVETNKAILLYAGSVIVFASWVTRETYSACRATHTNRRSA